MKDLPPIHKSHPHTTAPEVVERTLALSLEHPTRGCVFLSDRLKLEGTTDGRQATLYVPPDDNPWQAATQYARLVRQRQPAG